MQLKIWISSLLVATLSGCQLVAPLIVDYNGVRRDVAEFINGHLWFTIPQKRILVEYAKGQQKILTADRLSPEAQQALAQERYEGRYCAAQKIAVSKLDQVDEKIFVYADQQQRWQQIQQLQQTLKLDVQQLNCEHKF
ncbi:hypothetical protein [Acinetobacter indicus]|uniref:hypothetical protein n=1 Tax=Acinetobacter indicus TaxID=756892 RepID=UPI0020905F84|nr:hypothetical protein [Acinetobacter indicus]